MTTIYPNTNTGTVVTPIKHLTVSVTVPLLTLILAACGDSDIPALQRDAIIEAQERITANQELQIDEAAAALADRPETTEQEADNSSSEISDSEPAEPPATIDLTGYELVLNETFSGESLNAELWTTAFRWGPDLVVNDEEQYYVDTLNNPDFGFNPFVMDGNTLSISADNTPVNLLDAANQQPYLSGVLTTADRFAFTHGIAEIRARIPAGTGLWPQFWMLPDVFEGLRPQVFIMEARGDRTDTVFHSYKYQDSNDDLQTTGVLESTGTDFSADFHTYAVEWNPGELIFYIDGVEFQRVESENVASQDMYMIVNLAVGGFFAGSPDESTPFPAQLVIDHIRVFQLSE